MKETHDWVSTQLTITSRVICALMLLMVIIGVLAFPTALALYLILVLGANL